MLASRLRLAQVVFSYGVLSALVAACALGLGDADDPFYHYMRPRLGHFSRYEPSSPYARLYESYFENVIKNNDRAMESIKVDDWRKLRPTAELCIDFLMGLKVKSYVMRKPYEVIILDACLDWLFNDADATTRDEKSLDLSKLDSSRKASVKMLEKDAKLEQIYKSTKFAGAQLPAALLGAIHEYLVRLMQVYSENPRNGCHSHWLEAYNDFIDDTYVADCDDEEQCQFYGGLEGSESDSYLTMIAESTREASKTCYNVMQQQMRGLMETEFEHSNSGPSTFTSRLLKTQVSRQLEREKWAREMVSILQLASGIDQSTPVNLGEVVAALDAIKEGDAETIKRFTDALQEYALKNVDLKDTANDPNGRGRFGRAMTKLCRPYTDYRKFLAATGGINTDDDDSERKPFEFYNLIYSLVRLTNHESIFGIRKEQFEDDVIKNRWEALYLATFACQIISTTWGELNYETNVGSFTVMLRPDAGIMIADWPIELLREKLPLLYQKSGGGGGGGAQKSAPAKKIERRGTIKGSRAMFGKKFKLSFFSSPDEDGAGSGSGDKQEAPEVAAKKEPEAAAPLPGLAAIMDEPAKKPSERNVHYAGEQRQVAAPVAPPPQPAAALIQPAGGEAAARDAPIMSLDTILMYKRLHGRYPSLPDYYKKIYPELPDDLSGEYPKESIAPPRPESPAARAKKAPAKPDYGSLAGLKFK